MSSCEAWVTLATNDAYSIGALTLAASLRRVATTRQIIVMVTGQVSPHMMASLKESFDGVVSVEALDSGDLASLSLMDRTELGITFTKIRCWTLTQFNKAVFLDADTLVLQNCDELFDREELSAAPDAGWPDCFNSGVFVFRPNLETYEALISHANSAGSFDGGDQGLLNDFYSSWAHKDITKHLPFLYNMVASATYSYLPAFKRFGNDVKIVHFIGASKPWLARFDEHGEASLGSTEKHTANYLRLWWQIFSNEVKATVSNQYVECAEISGMTSAMPECLGTVTMGEAYSHPPPPPPQDNSESRGNLEVIKRQSWEEGRPDFEGTASFDNIKAKIDKTMSSTKEEQK